MVEPFPCLFTGGLARGRLVGDGVASLSEPAILAPRDRRFGGVSAAGPPAGCAEVDGFLWEDVAGADGSFNSFEANGVHAASLAAFLAQARQVPRSAMTRSAGALQRPLKIDEAPSGSCVTCFSLLRPQQVASHDTSRPRASRLCSVRRSCAPSDEQHVQPHAASPQNTTKTPTEPSATKATSQRLTSNSDCSLGAGSCRARARAASSLLEIASSTIVLSSISGFRLRLATCPALRIATREDWAVPPTRRAAGLSCLACDLSRTGRAVLIQQTVRVRLGLAVRPPPGGL